MVEIETTARQWLPYLLRGRPHQVIYNNANPTPYLLRWYIIPRNRWLNIYLHKFLRDDDDRALHDHPWPFWSLLFNRGYLEYTTQAPNPHVRKPWSLAFRPAEWRHRVALPHRFYMHEGFKCYGPQPVWTLVITGPKCRTWGFWCTTYGDPDHGMWSENGERFVRWQDWSESDGCGEN